MHLSGGNSFSHQPLDRCFRFLSVTGAHVHLCASFCQVFNRSETYSCTGWQRYLNKCLRLGVQHILSARDDNHLSGEIGKVLLWVKTVGEKHDQLLFLNGEVPV
jgi:hypothetical protein